jgi:hypothetical protein
MPQIRISTGQALDRFSPDEVYVSGVLPCSRQPDEGFFRVEDPTCEQEDGSMNRVGILGASMVLLTCLLTSCSPNVTSRLPPVFETEYLNSQTSTQPIDLSSGGECPGTRTLHVVSKDT